MRPTRADATGSRRPATASTFWIFAAIYGVFMFAASAPSPLYGTYASRFSFSPSTLTVVFAVYAIALLAALLIVGRLSDHLGRRPVILTSIVLQIIGMLCFVLANSTIVLVVGRVIQGVATGSAIGALSAGIIEGAATVSPGLAPMVTSSTPSYGLAVGAVGSSTLVQYAPAPLHLIYWVIIAALVIGAVATIWSPEPGQRRPGAARSLVPVASVPPYARASFAKVAPSVVAGWALSGFYLSLGSTLVPRIEHSTNHLWRGAAVFSFAFAAGTLSLATRRMSVRTALRAGPTAFAVGALLSLLAIDTGSGALFLMGGMIAGAGFGTGFLGGVRAVSEAARPHERAGVLAVFYVISYLAFSVPVVAAGIAQTHSSPQDVAMVYSGAVAALAVIGVAASLFTRRTAPTPPTADTALSETPSTMSSRCQ
ncbi:MFS transporter [Streptomyces sp. NPDC057757]|uniref:MFS transporter n=1 Tax=Streptomyces sp. NPDC057757 TaxID=3346241 RepID=UPI0036C89B4E